MYTNTHEHLYTHNDLKSSIKKSYQFLVTGWGHSRTGCLLLTTSVSLSCRHGPTSRTPWKTPWSQWGRSSTHSSRTCRGASVAGSWVRSLTLPQIRPELIYSLRKFKSENSIRKTRLVKHHLLGFSNTQEKTSRAQSVGADSRFQVSPSYWSIWQPICPGQSLPLAPLENCIFPHHNSPAAKYF